MTEGFPYTDRDTQAHRTLRILLVYRLAEHRLRTRLAETKQTIPNQLNKSTARPTMRWIFQCFEGIELLHIHSTVGVQFLILGLQPVHRLVLMLLGPCYEKSTKPLHETAECGLQVADLSHSPADTHYCQVDSHTKVCKISENE